MFAKPGLLVCKTEVTTPNELMSQGDHETCGVSSVTCGREWRACLVQTAGRQTITSEQGHAHTGG